MTVAGELPRCRRCNDLLDGRDFRTKWCDQCRVIVRNERQRQRNRDRVRPTKPVKRAPEQKIPKEWKRYGS